MNYNYIILGSILILFTTVSCVQKTYKKTAHFKVELNHVEEVVTVGIRGELPPLSWSQDAVMQDNDGDKVYEITVVFDIPYDEIEYKYVLNGEQFEYVDKNNRVLRFNEDNQAQTQDVFDR